MPTVQSINVINVGNVPITADGVATFSGNYSQFLRLPEDFNPGTKDFTYVVDFTPSNNYLTYTYYGVATSEGSTDGFSPAYINSGTLRGYFSSNGTSWNVHDGSTQIMSITAGVHYRIKAERVGNTVTWYSYDFNNNTWGTARFILSVGSAAPYPIRPILGSNRGTGWGWDGTIDLKECYIDIDGERWWEGVTYEPEPEETLENSLILGDTFINAVKLGSLNIERIYLGDNLIYGAELKEELPYIIDPSHMRLNSGNVTAGSFDDFLKGGSVTIATTPNAWNEYVNGFYIQDVPSLGLSKISYHIETSEAGAYAYHQYSNTGSDPWTTFGSNFEDGSTAIIDNSIALSSNYIRNLMRAANWNHSVSFTLSNLAIEKQGWRTLTSNDYTITSGTNQTLRYEDGDGIEQSEIIPGLSDIIYFNSKAKPTQVTITLSGNNFTTSSSSIRVRNEAGVELGAVTWGTSQAVYTPITINLTETECIALVIRYNTNFINATSTSTSISGTIQTA